MNSLKVVCDQLSSDKIKERQEGISSIRIIFSRDSLINNLDEKGTGKPWLAVYQALFETAIKEKGLCTKRTTKFTSTAAAERRLSEAASAIRWLTERCVRKLRGKVIKVLIIHFLQMCVHEGQLYAPVALDYAKAIRCIVSYAPHLEHLDEEMWVKIVEMGFNVVLDDSLRKRLGDEEIEVEISVGMAAIGDDLDYYQGDEDEDEEGNVPSTSASPTKKRRRREASATPGPSTSRASFSTEASRPVSLEQIEFTSLLAVLFLSPSAPLLSPNYPHLATGILNRLLRFIRLYPMDTSLHQDFLAGLSATLSHLALNKRDAVSQFARGAWDGLIGMWGTKNKSMKEALVVVLRILFPYYTASNSNPGSPYTDGVVKLWHLLDGEADSRWGIDGLSIDCLRMQLILPHAAEEGEPSPFVARTFRFGWNFDSLQALAWAILELQADCAEKLYLLSETVHTPMQSFSKKDGKRIKLENPISSLLSSIRIQTVSAIRAYHLEILLFIIDRHWAVLHDELQQEVISTLLQFIAFDDAVVQSWTFLCLTAIAEQQVHVKPSGTRGLSTWDPVWTHAMRRANVPIVCRAACHLAYTLLLYSKQLLTSQRVLVEIETLAKDLDVQGPPFPYDSVCIFLALCLQVASQDMRLYRMHLEEKVLTRGNSPDGGRTKLSHPTVVDMMTLLESICGLPKRSSLICRTTLPQCAIVDQIKEEQRTAVIRRFLLYAQLPPFHTPSAPNTNLSIGPTANQPNANILADFAQPGDRERKVSAALLKFLESLISDWESMPDAGAHASADKTRRFLDCAVMALAFESILAFNGIRSNRRVLRVSCKLIAHVTPLLTSQRWSLDEKALVLLGFEPLISAGEDREDPPWEGLLSPDQGTGIRKEVLRSLISSTAVKRRQMLASRRELQRIIWQSSDVQDIFAEVMVTLKNVLRFILTRLTGDRHSSNAMDVDDKDDFGPIRTTPLAANTPEAQRQTKGTSSAQDVMAVCMAFLALGPILQSSSGEPTRDKELTRLILDSDGDEFLLASSSYFSNVRQRTLNLNVTTLDHFLEKFESLLIQYTYSLNGQLQLLVIQFLESTISLWTQGPVADSETGEHARSLCRWLLDSLGGGKTRCWKIRDSIVTFLDQYLAQDPMEKVWSMSYFDDDDDEIRPSIVPTAALPTMSNDQDIRVRFRVANANARLFTLSRFQHSNPMELYDTIRKGLCIDLSKFEHMITRLLTLGNIMVVSSAIRRGPYWHLLEICHFTDKYSHHIEIIFNGVSERMGLSKPSGLFEVYVSQIAFSIFKADDMDFLRFPPSVLGYLDRKECAEAAFRAFTPVNILAGGQDQKQIADGRRLFKNHCQAISKSTTQGFRDCFADCVGYELASWADNYMQPEATVFPDVLERDLMDKIGSWDPEMPVEENLRQNVDGIIVAILRTLRDQDCRAEGIIYQQLCLQQSDRVAQAFQVLTRHRSVDDTQAHQPNLPAFPTKTVLLSLRWLCARVPNATSPATTYHVLHQLLSDVQQSPLVYEQKRYLNALCLWISCHYRHFREPILLHALVNGASSLLAQIDLARAAQSILEWAFGQYAKAGDKNSRLTDVLIRVCCLAHDYTTSADVDISATGADLLQWLENQVIFLSTLPKIKPQIIKALLAWPREPCEELASLYAVISSASLSSILADPRITSNKFRVVRRLRDLSFTRQYPASQFSRMDFWRLKDCIPPSHQLQDADIDAFSNLLLVHKGQIHSFGTSPLSAQVMHHQRHWISRTESETDFGTTADSANSERSILEHLLTMLNSDAPSRVHVAYRVLRNLASTELPDIQVWSTEYLTETNYFRECPHPAISRPHVDIRNALDSKSLVEMANDFSRWVPTIATLFSDALGTDNPFYAQLAVILQSDTAFADQTLPTLVHTLLQFNLSNAASGEGSSCRSALSRYFTSVLSSASSDVLSLRAVVNIVLHLRHFLPGHTTDASAYDKWLDLDFMLLSQSAIACGAYTTALLFHELAVEYQGDTLLRRVDDAEKILFDIYSHIEEPDSFYGIKAHDFHHFLMKRLHHEQQWEKAFQFHGAAMEANNRDPEEAEGVLQSLHSFGFDNLALGIQQNVSNFVEGSQGVATMSYHLGWRTETWDLPEQIGTHSPGVTLYQALRAVYRERDPRAIEATVRTALLEEMNRLRILGDEDLAGVHEATQNLVCLSQVKLWGSSAIQHSLQSKNLDPEQWSDFSQIDPEFDFRTLESIMATRISLLRSVRQKEQRIQIGTIRTPFVSELFDIERRCLIRISEAARDSQNLQVALNSVTRAQHLEQKHKSNPNTSQEFASVLWLKKEPKSAVGYMQDLIDRHFQTTYLQDTQAYAQKARLLSRLGSWSSEACLQKPTDIWHQYFKPAASLLNELLSSAATPDSTHAAVYHECAVFADRQYQAVVKSPDAIRVKMYADRKAKEMEDRSQQMARLQLGSAEYRELHSDQEKAKKQLTEDKARYSKHTQARNIFLQQAIDMYSRCLHASDAFDEDGHIRLASLWFANFDDPSVQETVRASVDRIPSRKFVFLAHQLSARLSKPSNGSPSEGQQLLQSLMLRMCSEHPFHSLYQVYCLRPPSPGSAPSRRLSARHDPSFSQGERAAAANDIFDRLRVETSTAARLKDVESVCYASLHWAKYSIKDRLRRKGNGPYPIPDDLPIRKLRNVPVPILTIHTPLDPTMKYQDCVCISYYETDFETAGGINLPKITICRGSDGAKYKQLFKGEGDDDLRQDAVMEQVFDLVNVVLRSDRETRKRNLSIRGYKVIPLAVQAGILEFVGNTSPLSNWLNKAHPKYNRDDISSLEFSKKMSEMRKQNDKNPSLNTMLITLFNKLRPKFRPVMRHYFTEKQKMPMSWFAMRLNYTRSVATTSIVGHILGLGDRHTSNILMDNGTGEAVPIDLGIAFEQGKLLHVPELVPFRMTADMVDGMGSSGTQGVFQRCAEETLRVLREGSEVILTVLEVFKYDPLHSWTANEFKLKRVQGNSNDPAQPQPQPTRDNTRMGIGIDMSSGGVDEAADRALTSVARKLDKSLSVEYTVNELIAEATDPANLACMFIGWSPHH
ncbi:hypothetical protein EW146_g5182 [Bondarzewia mesenterica]|uniref:Serine/threonine-protein kinase Tel1 n=1 Tax=Bondarzewia mesenterica TaxID=1095465 RepID=A0A4S4LU38_9AGAM|nr:hypothetical protein EW146_g5182 [Bondarzewia mesenterica]